jgi:hypothetical protein
MADGVQVISIGRKGTIKEQSALSNILFWNEDVRVESLLSRYTSKFGEGWRTKVQIKPKRVTKIEVQ